MNWPHWTIEAELLCRAVDREIAQSPIYVVNGDKLPAMLRMQDECLAFTGGLVDRALRSWLAERGRWKGPGFACVVYPSRFASFDRQAVLGVVLHELAHHACHLAVKAYVAARGVKVRQPAAAGREQLTTLGAPETTPWESHASNFIRACVHLVYRANRIRYRFGADSVAYAGPRYGLSDASRYALALGDEPARLAHLPLSEILQRDEPRDFASLFAADKRRWRQEQPC